MPLPKFLSGTYKRYKADTDRFATWLAETAKACREADGLSLPIQDGSAKSKYKISLEDFTKFSEIISRHGGIKVPQLIVAVARRAISLRRRFAKYFKSKIDDSIDDKGHTHFIGVLEQALENLGVLDDAPTVSTSLTTATAAPDLGNIISDEAMNRFSILDLEEPTETDEGPSNKKAKIEPPHDIKFELEDEFDTDQESVWLACFCLLEDLKNIRNFLTQTWTDYREGRVDLMSASVTTNTALALGRQAIEEAEKIKGFPKDPKEFHNYTFAVMGVVNGFNPLAVRPGDSFNMEMFDIADFTYVTTYITLISFCDVLTPGAVPQYKKGHFGIYNPNHDRSKMSNRDKYKEDFIVLCQALPDFAFLARYKVPIPGEDELTAGLRKMIETKKVSLWLSFATQIYLDVHHVLRANIGKGFQELRLTGLRAKKTLDDHFKFSKTISCPLPTWPPNADKALNAIQHDIEKFIVRDFFQEVISKDAPVAKEDEFSFLRWHPVQAGILMFNINLRMRDLGVSLVNAWGSVVYLAYLYNQVQKDGVVSVDWPDMDKIVEFHSEERLFIGRKPETVEDSFKKCSIMLGAAPESFVAKKVIHSKNGPRGLEESTAVAQLFEDHYTRGGSLDLSVANVSRLLNDLAQSEALKESKTGPHASRRLKRKWQATQTLSPLQLLAALRERLIDEEPKLIFNYFGMHKRGIELMRLIRIEVNDKLIQYFGKKYIEEEYQLSYVIMYLFQVALMSGKAGKMMGMVSAGGQTGSLIMKRAGTVMQDYLRKNGAVGCKELKAFCKNEKHTKEEAEKEGNRREENVEFWFSLEDVLGPAQMVALQTGIGF